MRFRRRSRGWPANTVATRELRFAGDALASAEVAAIDATASLGLVGRSGTKRIGLATGMDWAYAGYFRQVHSAPPIGASTNLRGNPITALPNTAVPIDGNGTVMAVLANLPAQPR